MLKWKEERWEFRKDGTVVCSRADLAEPLWEGKWRFRGGNLTVTHGSYEVVHEPGSKTCTIWIDRHTDYWHSFPNEPFRMKRE